MMGLLPFGMVTILLLTLVSNSMLPLTRWSSKTISPKSTWTGTGNQDSLGNWWPSNYVTTFDSGVKIQKFNRNNGQLSNIDATLNGQVVASTTATNSYFLLRNNGNLDQVAGDTTIYTSRTAPLYAPIQWSNGASTRCITGVRPNNVISFNLCAHRAINQQWMLRSNGQVYNYGAMKCLDVAADNSAQSNICDSTKSTQKWRWENGYLKLIATGKCLRVKSAIGTSFSLETGLCDGPRMVWNK
jgi:hypothetical protein